MLHLLHIENIAVIEEADIAFSSGFNALTGETGAGKSIVIDAMGAVLGQRLRQRGIHRFAFSPGSGRFVPCPGRRGAAPPTGNLR